MDGETPEETTPLAPSPFGPGDDHPHSPAVVPGVARAPLGPGDDDPRSPARGLAVEPVAPLGSGAATGENPDAAFDFLVTSPPGPGAPAISQRQLVRIPKPEPAATLASIAAVVVDPSRRDRRAQKTKE
jgi:hypothetical protein